MFAFCFSNNILHFYYPNASDNYSGVVYLSGSFSSEITFLFPVLHLLKACALSDFKLIYQDHSMYLIIQICYVYRSSVN